MHVEALDEPRTVAQRAAPLLAADPAGTTVLASVLAREIDLPGDEPCWWYLVVDADEPVGLAMHDGAWPPYLGPMPVEGAEALADRDLVLDWSLAFSADARTPTRGVARAIEHRLHRRGGGYVLWCLDGEPVSLAGMGRPSYGVARIGPVYTPPAWRRRGFGAAVTAAASSRLLQTGARDVVLFTDLGNPTSNKIYQQIGFRPVRDFVEVRLA